MIRISLGVGLALALVAVAVPASAQVRRHDGYPYAMNGSYGFDYGYREGLQHGERDARQNRPFDFNDSNDYRRADRGYDRRTGDVNSYRRDFRRGYEAGYRDGYSRSGGWDRNRNPNGRYDRYPNGGNRRYPNGGYYPDSRYGYPGGGYGNRGYAGPASQYGFSEGYEKGLEDLRDRDPYEPARHKWYREGDRHYNNRYGPREAYKNEYRIAFREGYDRAFREAGARYRY